MSTCALAISVPCNRGAEVILALVDRVGAHHRVDEVARKFLHQIQRVGLAGTGLSRLGREAFQLLLLADVGRKR